MIASRDLTKPNDREDFEIGGRRFRGASSPERELLTGETLVHLAKCGSIMRDSPQPTVLVDEAGDLLALGAIRPEALPSSTYRQAWKIDTLAIRRGVQDDGAGPALLAYLLGLARQGRAAIIWCDVSPDATAMFRSFGFTTTAGEGTTDASTRMTCRADGVVETSRASLVDEIYRVGSLPRLSRAVVFNRMAHVGGLLPNRSDVSVSEQTREILEKIDAILDAAGTDRGRLLSVTVWVSDLRHVGEVNSVWEAWLPPGAAPARACVQALPGSKEYAVEIAAIAAV